MVEQKLLNQNSVQVKQNISKSIDHVKADKFNAFVYISKFTCNASIFDVIIICSDGEKCLNLAKNVRPSQKNELFG